MKRKLIEAFPKYAIAIGVIVLSSVMFAFWWYTRSSGLPVHQESRAANVPDNTRQQKAATLPAKMGWLAMVGSDLYDVSTGELIFANWLSGIPQKLFYQPGTNKLMVQAERGVMRFGMDGRQDAVMGENSPPAFSQDGSKAMFVRDGDIWLADTDWNNFKLLGERQATKGGQFNKAFFSANLRLYSDNALIVRQDNNLVRVDLKNGDIKQVSIPQYKQEKWRSPDGRMLFGDERGKLVLFDVDKASATVVPNARERVFDFQWMGNEACAFINDNGGSVSLYDRKSGKVSDIAKLPFNPVYALEEVR